MFYNTLDSYGTSGADGFLDESETPESTDSSYTRHSIGGNHNDKEAVFEQDSISVISNCKN